MAGKFTFTFRLGKAGQTPLQATPDVRTDATTGIDKSGAPAAGQEAGSENGEMPEETSDAEGSHMPGAMEATEGIASEITTHDEKAMAEASELSPEEQAISGLQTQEPDPIRDENDDAAALAGRETGRELVGHGYFLMMHFTNGVTLTPGGAALFVST